MAHQRYGQYELTPSIVSGMSHPNKHFTKVGIMAKAIWNGQVVAESEHTEKVEGNHYFPPDSINSEFFSDSPTTTVCGWKGTAKYYNLVVDGQTNADAAWFYPEPKSDAANIKAHVAFWKGVKVED